jgi:hypothetical protein
MCGGWASSPISSPMGGKSGTLIIVDIFTREAQFLQTYSDRITFLNVGNHAESPQLRIEAAGIKYQLAAQESLVFNENSVSERGNDARLHAFQIAYTALGCPPPQEPNWRASSARSVSRTEPLRSNHINKRR